LALETVPNLDRLSFNHHLYHSFYYSRRFLMFNERIIHMTQKDHREFAYSRICAACGFYAHAKTEDESMENAKRHAIEVHGMKEIPPDPSRHFTHKRQHGGSSQIHQGRGAEGLPLC
jgi:predicted small metal-binding protein